MRSVTCTSLRVSPWSFCRRVMMVTSRRVSWTATTTCCQTVSLVVASVRSSRSLLLALRLTLQLVKHRTVRAMRAVADALYRIPQPGLFLPKSALLALQGLWALPPTFLFLPNSCSCCISFINVSFVKEIGICYSFFLVNFSE